MKPLPPPPAAEAAKDGAKPAASTKEPTANGSVAPAEVQVAVEVAPAQPVSA